MKTKRPTQDQINSALWNACDTFRGAFDSSEYKNYILVFMFLKYLSDVWKDHYNQLKEEYGEDEELIQRKLKRERFVLPENCNFDYIYAHRNDTDIGEKIDKIFAKIEERNIEKLNGVFRNISFNSDKLGQTKDRNRRLKNLISDFSKPELDFRPSLWEDKEDILGEAYMYLLEKFASGAGKKGGEFFTPSEVSSLLAKLVAPKEGDRLFDPTCGSGSLLIKVAEETKDAKGRPTNNFAIYGQESNGDTWALSKMNCFLHSMDGAQIEWCDTINNPKLIEGDALMKFDIVVANPPFSLDKWGHENAEADRFKRFWRGVPPKSKGDYAFIQHMIETTAPDGKVGVIVPHGVLFRGSAEHKIRQKLIEENLLEAVIGLPTNLFYGTGIPAAILIFNKSRKSSSKSPRANSVSSVAETMSSRAESREENKVLFIDASKDYQDGKKQNKLRPQDIEKIVDTYSSFTEIEKYSHLATYEEIVENDFNLNIPRYVDTFEEEEPVDIEAVQKNIEQLETELVEVRSEMKQHLKELGYE